MTARTLAIVELMLDVLSPWVLKLCAASLIVPARVSVRAVTISDAFPAEAGLTAVVKGLSGETAGHT